MNIDKIKKEMYKYVDFYGGELITKDEINKVTTKKELAQLIEYHRDHIESMLCDANSHLDNFKRKLGLLCI